MFLLAATLRPETMAGQTNCWALPEGQYGAYRGLNNEVYVVTERAALNLSYQVRRVKGDEWRVVWYQERCLVRKGQCGTDRVATVCCAFVASEACAVADSWLNSLGR